MWGGGTERNQSAGETPPAPRSMCLLAGCQFIYVSKAGAYRLPSGIPVGTLSQHAPPLACSPRRTFYFLVQLTRVLFTSLIWP